MASTWYYAEANRQVGPVSEAELDSLVAAGTIRPDTLVWHEGLANWAPYQTVKPNAPANLPPPTSVDPYTSAAAVAAPEPTRFCSECGQSRPSREMVAFGDRLVCVNCKDRFTHQLRETGYTPGRFQYAGFWIRFLARIIDSIVMNIVILPVTFILMGATAFSAGSSDPNVIGPAVMAAQGLVMLFAFAVAIGYDTFFVYKFGATPGKMVVGKKVVMADGSPLTLGRAFGRYLAYIVSSFTIGIGFIIAAFDDEKRALHDRICDTRVVAK